MEDLWLESGEQARSGEEREWLSDSILGLHGDAVNCGAREVMCHNSLAMKLSLLWTLSQYVMC